MFRKSFYECSDEAQFADADAAFLRLQGPGERIQIAIEPARVAEPQAIDFDAVSTVDDDDPSQPLIEQCELVVGAQAEFEDLHERVVAEQRSGEHTSELQSLMRISYAVFCLKKKKTPQKT